MKIYLKEQFKKEYLIFNSPLEIEKPIEIIKTFLKEFKKLDSTLYSNYTIKKTSLENYIVTYKNYKGIERDIYYVYY